MSNYVDRQLQMEAQRQKLEQVNKALKEELQNNPAFASNRKLVKILLIIWLVAVAFDKSSVLFLSSHRILGTAISLAILLFLLALSALVYTGGRNFVGILPAMGGLYTFLQYAQGCTRAGTLLINPLIILGLLLGCVYLAVGLLLLLHPGVKAYCRRMREISGVGKGNAV